MAFHLIIYALSFIGIWVGSGMAIQSVERISKNLKISSFAVSFLVLGFFTSVSELSVGVNSIIKNDPEIYVGNLIGASIVIFMMIIPLLAMFGHGIKINGDFNGFNLIVSLVVIATPVILAMDGRIDRFDSLVTIILYGFLLISIQTRRGILERVKSFAQFQKVQTGRELVKIILGVVIIFTASKFLVDQTLYFSELLDISPFLISLLLIGIGTNIPELSLVVRSIFMGRNEVAFGDYVGSAAFNTFLIGALTIWYGKPAYLNNSYLISLLFLIVGLTLFYFFSKSKNTINRFEGMILLGIYIGFLLTEYFIHQ